MRWVFLLLVILNAFYYVWHQQEVPLKAKEVMPLSLYKGGQQDIRLLHEPDAGSHPEAPAASKGDDCLYLGGDMPQKEVRTVEQRLLSLDIQVHLTEGQGEGGKGNWLRIEPDSRRLVGDAMLDGLRHDFPSLKSKIMSCEGIATSN